MKSLILSLAVMAAAAFAQTNEGERPRPKPDVQPDSVPACPKKAAVFVEGVIFYCAGWAAFVPRELDPAPSDADNPARLRILLANAAHGYTPPNMALEEKRLSGTS